MSTELDTTVTPAMVTITLKEYSDLIQSSAWLEALEAAGVDDWEGISFARELLEVEDSEE